PEALREPPRPEPAPPEPAPERAPARTARGAAGAAVAAAIALAIVGFIVGGAGGDETTAAAGTPFRSGDVELLAPDGWRPVDAPAIPGLELEAPVAIASGGDAGGPGVVAGFAPDTAHNHLLLPDAFVTAIGGPPASRPAVLLPRARLEAYRYADGEIEGFPDRATVFTAQTTVGVVVAACFGPAAATPATCDAVAGTLRVSRGEGLPLGPDPELATRLGGILAKLDKAAGGARARLAGARTNRTQAAAAAQAARAHAAAATAVGAIEPRPADAALVASLGQALRGARGAYDNLAAAARRSDRRAYARARAAVGAAAKQLRGALAAFEAAGYAGDA
ncbi:MAG TPA: hypothetical protein VM266_16200, partial [Solirubrobacteraceae bacterium]|nr:hypothetical protein [Solirubrobacteraceae bacterium]